MTPRGPVLYATTALVLLAGTTWWLRAAPAADPDPRLARWRTQAESMLPPTPDEQTGGTLTLPASSSREVVANLPVANYEVTVLCLGDVNTEVRVSLGPDDSGRGLSCATTHRTLTFKVALAGQLRMTLTVSTPGPVVVRYAVQKAD